MGSTGENSHEQYVIFYFQVHQPRRLSQVSFFDLPNEPLYFNDAVNESIARRVAHQCYVPANNLLLQLMDEFPEIKIAFSISGVALEQMQAYAPEAIEGFRKLASTGRVEFLAETYYHSLASLVNGHEFEEQVLEHAGKIFELFGVRPTVFRNTELIYNDLIGTRVANLGFRGIFTEGHRNLLGDRSPHNLYCHPGEQQLKIFLRNYRLSDDIAFHFMKHGHKLTVERYTSWLQAMPASDRLMNVAIDYETFGEHQQRDTGIFDFFRDLLKSLAASEKNRMLLPGEALQIFEAKTPLSAEAYVSGADVGRDLSPWLGNDMQKEAFNSVMKLESDVKALGDETLMRCWRYLQTSDHFYYMSVKTDIEGSMHRNLSPFPSSYEAFISFMNVVTHLTFRIQSRNAHPVRDEHDLAPREAERQGVKTSTPVWVMNLESVPQGNVPHTEG